MSSTQSPRYGRAVALVASSSAVLGPLLDNYHSQFGVLAYKHPIELHGDIGGVAINFATAPFTPPLFVVAGIAIALGTLTLNRMFPSTRFPVTDIDFPKAMASIASFSSIYYLSAALPNSQLAWATGPLLSALALAEWFYMDGSIGGLVMGALTAIGGPLVEVGLINIGKLYEYAQPEVLGIPLFIAPVYFAGGASVGNLARAAARGGREAGRENKS